jgi:cytochrome c oxidase cbb3-type subunit 3
MPRWWVYIFWATIIYAVVYFLNVIPGIGTGRGRIASYQDDMARAEQKYARFRAPAGPPAAAALAALAEDPAARDAGKAVFEKNCAACHMPDGGGLIGPNLTDDYWLHGGRPAEIWTTVHDGVLDKGMPAWGPVLQPDELQKVVAFVMSLHGTTPANPKEPQGTKAESAEETHE